MKLVVCLVCAVLSARNAEFIPRTAPSATVATCAQKPSPASTQEQPAETPAAASTLTMADLAVQQTTGVSAFEVSD